MLKRLDMVEWAFESRQNSTKRIIVEGLPPGESDMHEGFLGVPEATGPHSPAITYLTVQWHVASRSGKQLH